MWRQANLDYYNTQTHSERQLRKQAAAIVADDDDTDTANKDSTAKDEQGTAKMMGSFNFSALVDAASKLTNRQ